MLSGIGHASLKIFYEVDVFKRAFKIICHGKVFFLNSLLDSVDPDDEEVPTKYLPLTNISGHLSNIRAIAKEEMAEENKWLLASVGGRAQMIIWKFEFDIECKCGFLNVLYVLFL